MHKHSVLPTLAFAVSLGFGFVLTRAGGFADEAEPMVREIFVPFESLEALLEGQPRRVLLSRQEYEGLLAKAKKVPESRPPRDVVLLQADYAASVDEEGAQWTASLVVDVLGDSLYAVPLELSGVGLRRAVLDGQAAAMGRATEDRLILFVEGKGRHELLLEMVSPLETTAAQQVLKFHLPRPPAARLRLTVPGDVEVKSGADVVSRVFDEAAEVTRFELLPAAGDTTLVMTLNSRLLRRERVVVARSVLVDEVTQAYERLHATVSLGVLHRAVDGFRFVVPEGFDVTEVSSPLLARWAIEGDGPRRVLDVRLREQTTETVVLNVSAVKTPPRLDDWSLPKLQPLDVVGQVAVVGLLVDERLKAESMAADRLIPIDTAVLRRAIPETVFHAEPHDAPLRPIVAYYAPQGEFDLAARFVKPPAATAVTTNVLLLLEEQGQKARGQFLLTPEVEKLFGFDFSVPAAWHVTGVTAADQKPLAFERYGPKDQPGRIRVRLPSGVAPGETYAVCFQAESTPGGWLDDWQSRQEEFPIFAVDGATRDVGAIAVDARDDLAVRPATPPQRLTPLDAAQKARYGLTDAAATLVYRYESQPYQATLAVERTQPRLTARTFSFLRVEPEGLSAHYEIAYQIEHARTRRLALQLPEATPAALSIRGLDGVKLKEFVSEPADGARRWNVMLEEPRRGQVRLAVDFQQPLPNEEPENFSLPIVAADDVAYQSGLVSVEGNPELEVQVRTEARRVDVGELVDADYQPGRGLLGAYGFVGDPVEVTIDVFRHPPLRLDPAIVQRAELTTLVSADGVNQTAARFDLRTKALYLEVKLPPGAELWSADLDGEPIKPQREAGSLLVSLPAGPRGAVRSLRIVYEDSVDSVALIGTIEMAAPKLLLRADRGASALEVPIADLVWHLRLPAGYEVTRSDGTVVTTVKRPEPAALTVARHVVGLAFACPLMSPAVQYAREPAQRAASVHERLADVDRSMATQTAEMDEEAAEEEGEPTAVGQEGGAEPAPAAPPGTRPGEPQQPIAQQESAVAPPKRPAPASRRLKGFSSLKIDLAESPEGYEDKITFQSLGVDPRLEVTLAHRPRFDALGWALALAVGLAGLALGGRPVRLKTRFVLAVVVLGTLVPLIPGLEEMAVAANMAVYAASLLVPYYLLAGCVKAFAALFRRKSKGPAAAAAATAAVLAACLLAPATEAADGPYVIQVVEPPEPVKVPEDAIILPYDPDSATGIQDADRMLVPYAKYVELWNRAYPNEKPEVKPPAPYGLAGASYATTLEGDEYLLVEGQLEVDVYTDEHVTVPLGLAGGVLARAELDGKPARLSVPSVAETPNQPSVQQAEQQARPQAADQRNRQAPEPVRPFVLLHVAGKGRHLLELGVRLRLERRGGWRVASGVLPSAPAGAIQITVPKPRTEVRLGEVADRRSYETKRADQRIETALAAGGVVSIQWRPKVAEGQVDPSLSACSRATLDVQEDGLRLAWQVTFEFPRGQRDAFSVDIPKEYLVEQVEGTNVRGWEVRPEEQHQTVEVSLLKTARDRDSFSIRLWRAGAVGQGGLSEFDVPVVRVGDAVLESGELTIRRSRLLDLRSVSTSGVTRTDLSAPSDTVQATAGAGIEESPLGLRPYQAYRFVTAPFSIRLAASPVASKVTAEVQTVLKIAEYERSMESRVNLSVQDRPVYRVEIFLPEDFELEDVSAPGEFEWALTRRDDRPLLTVYLATGQQGRVPIVLRATLPTEKPTDPLPLPRLELVGVQRQEGDIAVQADPAFEVQTRDLENCQSVLLERLYGWLNPEGRPLTRLALHYRRPDYRGTLVLSLRAPRVACDTITNVRVTDRAVEETILLDFTIQHAGIREVSFLLPAWMEDSRINAPMLRQKTIEPAGDAPGAPLRVRLEFQDEMMDNLRVLVENDRLLTPESQAAPIPIVETDRPGQTWQTNRQFVALESAGRDEVVVEKADGLERLSRQQRDWQTLKSRLGGGITLAYVVRRDAQEARLEFALRQRAALETAGARIGLAETNLVVDVGGAYRGEQIYRMDNTTEQFLQIKLPEGARLWTARVAGEPVKPTEVPGAKDPRLVRIPLVKTAPGDLDYAVVLKYGGQMPPLGSLGAARVPVRFPLVRTANINVELSQVRLYLPETHRWFDFDGTMTPVTDEEDLTAGYISYQTKVAERLAETVQHAGEFAQVRAANSLLNLKRALDFGGYGSVSRRYGGEKVRREYEKNVSVLRDAERQLAQLGEAVKEDVELDNRDRLNELYQRQQTDRARNVVQGLGRNFREPEDRKASEVAGKEVRFSTEWLDKSQLSNTKRAAVSDEGQKRLAAPLTGKTALKKGPPPAALPSAQFRAPVLGRRPRLRLLRLRPRRSTGRRPQPLQARTHAAAGPATGCRLRCPLAVGSPRGPTVANRRRREAARQWRNGRKASPVGRRGASGAVGRRRPAAGWSRRARWFAGRPGQSRR